MPGRASWYCGSMTEITPTTKARRLLPNGTTFGRWTVIGIGSVTAKYPSHQKMLVRCICGTQGEVTATELRTGKSQSCGCLQWSERQAKYLAPAGTKICRALCGEPRLLADFPPSTNTLDGRGSYCYRCKRELDLLRLFNITSAQYEEMAANGCMICGSFDPGNGNEHFCVDHDHNCCRGKQSCGKCVRGVLCIQCNKAIGLLKDSLEIVEATANYLRRARETAQ